MGEVYRARDTRLDVSSDGKKFPINAAADENTRPLTLVVHWEMELQKK